MKSGFLPFFRNLRDGLWTRLPAFADILPVFALIATMFYGWSMVVFLWKLPGWLFFLTIGEIAGIFAYQMTTNLLESLAMVFLLLIVSIALPQRIFRNVFIARAGMASLVLIASMMLFLNRYVSTGPKFGDYLFAWMLGTVLLSALLSMLSIRVRFLGNSIAWLSDRLIVFLFVLVPLSALSLPYVIAMIFK